MTPEVSEARARFPSGLLQPEASFRFSEDALILQTSLSLPFVETNLWRIWGQDAVSSALPCCWPAPLFA